MRFGLLQIRQSGKARVEKGTSWEDAARNGKTFFATEVTEIPGWLFSVDSVISVANELLFSGSMRRQCLRQVG